MTSFPPNFIPIVDAFNQAVDRLSPQIAGPAEDPKDLSQAELIEFEDKLGEFFPTEGCGGTPSREAVSGCACRRLRKGVGQESGDRANGGAY